MPSRPIRHPRERSAHGLDVAAVHAAADVNTANDTVGADAAENESSKFRQKLATSAQIANWAKFNLEVVASTAGNIHNQKLQML